MSLFVQSTFPSLAKNSSTLLILRQQRSLTHRRSLQTSCLHRHLTNRRAVLVGLGLVAISNRNMSADASESKAILPEFGSEPRQLDKLIRVAVPRPRGSADGDTAVEVLMVEDIEIPNNEAVRFDVYVAKPSSDDLGELAGSLVQDGQSRTGRNYRKSGLNLGITNLVRRIGCQGCEELVVSLVPRSGELSIGGVRIDHFSNQ